MFRQNQFLTALLFSIILIFSCNKSVVSDVQTNAIAEDSQEQQKSVAPHPYGGWYCPDNFGFPPVDIQHLEKVPVVIGRLPTKEETRNGTSLMYFDPNEYPDAKPLDIALPRVAKINSKNNGLNELIIVIQAVVVNGDTAVGYRFPNGGNGIDSIGNFSPANAITGNNNLCYLVTDTNGCSSTENYQVVVLDYKPTLSVTDTAETCLNGADIEMLASPSGGQWSGPGLSSISDRITIEPSLFGAGTY